jgi:isopentenyldiphosphate isomerase
MKYAEPEPANELLSCFDESGKKIEPHTREEAHTTSDYWHAVVNIWIIDHNGRLLCSKRSETLKGNPGKWQTYFGGHLKSELDFIKAAEMELDEEIGLQINPSQLYLIQKGKYEPSRHFYESYAYIVNPEISNYLKFNDGEITEIRWLLFAEYEKSRSENPGTWCNPCTAENQARILGILSGNQF